MAPQSLIKETDNENLIERPADVQKPCFLTLPLNVRQKIYHFALVPERVFIEPFCLQRASGRAMMSRKSTRNQISLFYVSLEMMGQTITRQEDKFPAGKPAAKKIFAVSARLAGAEEYIVGKGSGDNTKWDDEGDGTEGHDAEINKGSENGPAQHVEDTDGNECKVEVHCQGAEASTHSFSSDYTTDTTPTFLDSAHEKDIARLNDLLWGRTLTFIRQRLQVVEKMSMGENADEEFENTQRGKTGDGKEEVRNEAEKVGKEVKMDPPNSPKRKVHREDVADGDGKDAEERIEPALKSKGKEKQNPKDTDATEDASLHNVGTAPTC
ncbi:hypothetical protein CISG_01633 [Coccidioides immitis RMSCC 3703]|uniref:Uncharacterized protein n=1 Tax=Coccidioides immitis RMSCC 3703 TaxID=454286 RepID=A0A0J8R4H2_COCIT|nr:hypothetical protein CISG_01633 [Coccidioides immitis RMSCC 3703]